MKTRLFFFVIGYLFSIQLYANPFQSLGLVHHKQNKSESLSISKDLRRWVFIFEVNSSFKNVENKWHIEDQYAQYYLASQNKLIITAGLNKNELDVVLKNTRKRSASVFYQLVISQAQAEVVCDKAISTPQQVATNITMSSVVQSCDWNIADMLIEEVKKTVQDVKELLSLDVLKKIDQLVSSVQKLAADLSSKIIPALTALSEVMPRLVQTWACEKLRDKVPAMAAALLLPQSAPVKIARVTVETLKEVENLLTSTIVQTVTNLVKSGELKERMLPILTKLHTSRPSFFDHISIHKGNFSVHANKHMPRINPQSSDLVFDYAKLVDAFSKKKDPHDLYYTSTTLRRVVKFNPMTGEVLTLRNSGDFVSYFVVRGNSPEERLKIYLQNQSNHQKLSISYRTLHFTSCQLKTKVVCIWVSD